MKNLPIEDATDEQLKTFLEKFLQLELAETVNTRAKVLAEFGKSGWNHPFVWVDDNAAPPVQAGSTEKPLPEPQQVVPLGNHYNGDPKVRLTVHGTSYPGGKHPASVSVNGSPNIVIQREKVVDLPYRFYLALLEAHEVHTSQDPKTREFIETRVQTYPMSVHALPSAQEVDAWFERTKDNVLA